MSFARCLGRWWGALPMAASLPGAAAAALMLAFALSCADRPADSDSPVDGSEGSSVTAADAPSDEIGAELPEADLTEMEPQVEQRLLETRAAALARPRSAAAWGRYGMVAHAHELWDQAAPAYRRAQELDPRERRWPYFLGDVLSVQGTELEAAAAGFRRALALGGDYAPARMRLGNVLIALDRTGEAVVELERALELAPDLQPARVALAQARLALGDLEESESLLEEVLRVEPRHGQALSTLGRVYMRQGRRDEAREIANRARDAASYNLYSDPLMGEVVNEGVSTVQIWERAKGFLEKENYEQAAIGLTRVVQLQPSNAEAHLQLAFAYGNLGELRRSRFHLERTVELDPDQADPRVDLGRLLLEEGRPAEAAEQLLRARELAPGHAEAPWLLGRARLETGDVQGALASFEAADEAAQGPAPRSARIAWGRALAQTGAGEAALPHFRAALAEDPDDAEALFYVGLVSEGLGRIDEAVSSYCRSLGARADSPAADRLRRLGASCP